MKNKTMKEEKKINWENRIRQLLVNVRKEDKDRKVINFVRQLRQDDIKSLIEWVDSKLENWASDEHDRWARWQAYVFSKSEWTGNGYLIPKDLCERWQRQIDTPYEKLSEQEKESDRKEVRKYLDDIISYLQSQLKDEK